MWGRDLKDRVVGREGRGRELGRIRPDAKYQVFTPQSWKSPNMWALSPEALLSTQMLVALKLPGAVPKISQEDRVLRISVNFFSALPSH